MAESDTGVYSQMYLVKTSGDGSIEWERRYANYEWAQSVSQTHDGGYILTSGYEHILKLDAAGDIVWSHTIPFTRFSCIKQTADYGFIAAGYINPDAQHVSDYEGRDVFIQKICASGALSWSRTFPPGYGEDGASSITQTSDGGYLITGVRTPESNPQERDLYVIKMDDQPAVCADTCSAYFTLYADTIQYHFVVENLASGVDPLTYAWSWGDGTYDSIPYPTHVYTAIGSYTVCLTITDITGCSNTFCNDLVFKTEAQMGYIRVIDPATTGIKNTETPHMSFILYPNPAGDLLSIDFNGDEENREHELQIFNTLGEMVHRETLRNNAQTISIIGLSPGIYYLGFGDGYMRFVKGY